MASTQKVQATLKHTVTAGEAGARTITLANKVILSEDLKNVFNKEQNLTYFMPVVGFGLATITNNGTDSTVVFSNTFPILAEGDNIYIDYAITDELRDETAKAHRQYEIDSAKRWTDAMGSSTGNALASAQNITATPAALGTNPEIPMEGYSAMMVGIKLAHSTSTDIRLKGIFRYGAGTADVFPATIHCNGNVTVVQDTTDGSFYLEFNIDGTGTRNYQLLINTYNAVSSIEFYVYCAGTLSGTPQITATYFRSWYPVTPSNIYAKLVSGGNEAWIDPISSRLGVIPVEHDKIHQGKRYIASEIVTLNGNRKYSISTAGMSKPGHLIVAVKAKGDATVNIYYGSSGASGGTALNIRNRNDLFQSRVNLSVASISAGATVTSNGSLWDQDFTGTNNPTTVIPGENNREELILQTASLYTVEIITTASIEVKVAFDFYEGGKDN